ncbi:hypothetical protein Tco_0745143 [Tanacetum coccineum]
MSSLSLLSVSWIVRSRSLTEDRRLVISIERYVMSDAQYRSIGRTNRRSSIKDLDLTIQETGGSESDDNGDGDVSENEDGDGSDGDDNEENE